MKSFILVAVAFVIVNLKVGAGTKNPSKFE